MYNVYEGSSKKYVDFMCVRFIFVHRKIDYG